MEITSKNRILSLINSRRLVEARSLCTEYCNNNIADADTWNLLATINGQLGLYADAEKCATQAIALSPKHAGAHFSHGVAMLGLYRLDMAEKSLHKAIILNPGNPTAWTALANVYSRANLLTQESSCYKKALSIYPKSVDLLYLLGKSLNLQGKNKEALECYQKALSLNPGHVLSMMGKCIAQLRVIYKDNAQLIKCRLHYQHELEQLAGSLKLKDAHEIEEASKAVGDQLPFLLAYQGLNDCSLQRTYGELVTRIQSKKYPEWSGKIATPASTHVEPVRVGFVSRFFYNHSNWKIPIKGWIENIDRTRFSLFGYYTGIVNDEYTDSARQSFTRFVEGNPTLVDLCKAIRHDNLHILIYPEIGMDHMTLKLASLRLAPIQCASWGHPETSGLPAIDYFLSSDLMEPPSAEAHYTEKLIRLPNLSVYYEPLGIDAAPVERQYFRLRSDSVLYFCAQSLYKYLPNYDEVFPRIALNVQNCQFAFISDSKSTDINRQFMERMRKVFSRYDLSHEKYICMLPVLDSKHYNAINNLSDIFLDSIGWSGCNSIMEAITYDLPIVTMPGAVMRSRHGFAILHVMGVTKTTAKSVDDYISLAARMGNDRNFRREISENIHNNKHRVYRDSTCISGLESFIEEAIAASRQPLTTSSPCGKKQ